MYHDVIGMDSLYIYLYTLAPTDSKYIHILYTVQCTQYSYIFIYFVEHILLLLPYIIQSPVPLTQSYVSIGPRQCGAYQAITQCRLLYSILKLFVAILQYLTGTVLRDISSLTNFETQKLFSKLFVFGKIVDHKVRNLRVHFHIF